MKKAMRTLSRASKAATKTANKVKLINAKADAALKKSQGKAIRERAKKVETERTKRSLGRSAAFSSAVANIADAHKTERETADLKKNNALLWNSIINGDNSSATENTGTSNNYKDSTTNTDRVN